MKKKTFLVIVILFIAALLAGVSYITFATNESALVDSAQSVLVNYELQVDDISLPNEAVLEIKEEVPEISDSSKVLLNNFHQDLSIADVEEVQSVYNRSLDRETTRVVSESYEIDIDATGEIVRYQNYDDYSTVDKDRRDYDENEVLPEMEYLIAEQTDLDDIIATIEEGLADYKLVDCSNHIQGSWMLSWCKDYGNGLVNPYDSVNVVVDAVDGSITLFGKSQIEPNTVTPVINEKQAIKASNSIISKLNEEVTEVTLNFVKPNFYWVDGGPYETANFVRLAWVVTTTSGATIHVDAVTSEILGGSQTLSSDYGRSLQVVAGTGRTHKVQLASAGLSTLGFNQTGYTPVDWDVTQADINYLFSASNLYGLYLCCHGYYNGTTHTIDDGALTWTKSSSGSYGNWHFVFLDACNSCAGNLWANALHATGSGRCFVGWNVNVAQSTSYSFAKRFWPRVRNYDNFR